MTNNNNLIPKENLAKVEEVREINNEIPSYEEFMSNYNADEKINDSYGGEVDSYGDLRVKGTYYGPGFWGDFWDDVKVVVKPVASGALVAASMFPPTAAIAVPIAVGVGATGAGLMGLGHVTDSNGLKEFGKDVAEIAFNSKDGLDITSDSGINSAARNNYFRK